MKEIFIFLTLIFSIISNASEVDQFTDRDSVLEDSTYLINKKTNEFLKKSIKNTNRISSNCNEYRLYKGLRKYFRNHVQGQLTPWILSSPEINKRFIPLSKTIYRDMDFFDSVILGGYSKVFKDSSGAIVRMGKFQIGSDKFEHFFGRGWAYYKRRYQKGHSVRRIHKYGNWLERYQLGATMTGVYSYGDLAANFNGMRFWNHILQKNSDVLGEDLGPYISCVDNKWVQVAEINWENYIDISWDEANNCSAFRKKRTARKISKRMEKLGLTCPLDPDAIKSTSLKYGDHAKFIINSKGHYSIK